MPSASGFPRLFEQFTGSTRPSDFPSTCTAQPLFPLFVHAELPRAPTAMALARMFFYTGLMSRRAFAPLALLRLHEGRWCRERLA